MEGRRVIDDEVGAPFVIEVDGRKYRFSDCYVFAETSNMQANIEETVLKTRDGDFLKITVVGEKAATDAYGIRKGWYVARIIDVDYAKKWRDAWSILRVQPDDPAGPCSG